MSLGKSKSKSQSTDPRVTQAFLDNYEAAKQTAGQIGPSRFADLTPDWYRAAQGIRDNAYAGMNDLQQGVRAALGVANFTPGTILGMDRSAYMNPYMDQVANRTMMDMDRQRQMMLDQVGDQAARAGAFGGNRHGVVEAETNRSYGDLFANQMAAMRMAGFDAASGLMNADLQRQMQGQQLNLAGAGMLGGLASQQQQMGLGGAQALMNLGLGEQAFNQQQLDALRNLPIERQQLINAALGLIPGGLGGTSRGRAFNMALGSGEE